MRIIAGQLRGRKLLAPEGIQTRPITDRAKQSLFDTIAPLIEGAHVYDCFAGTGSMGLECLSRGAARVTFFEGGRSTVALLRRNIEALDVRDRSVVVAADLFAWFDAVREVRPLIDLVFLDPPYRFVVDKLDRLRRLAQQLAEHHLTDDGTVVFRHDRRDRLELPPLTRYDERAYGSMTIELLHRSAT